MAGVVLSHCLPVWQSLGLSVLYNVVNYIIQYKHLLYLCVCDIMIGLRARAMLTGAPSVCCRVLTVLLRTASSPTLRSLVIMDLLGITQSDQLRDTFYFCL